MLVLAKGTVVSRKGSRCKLAYPKMAQLLNTNQTETDRVAPVTLPDGLLELRLVQGRTLRWAICFCQNSTTISAIDGDANTITTSQACALAAGDCVSISGHKPDCEEESLNGSVELVAANGTLLTIADVPFTGTEDFTPAIAIPGCPSQDVDPPRLCKIIDARNWAFAGTIMNRIATERTRLALVAQATEGSPYVQILEGGDDVYVGDSFTFSTGGFTNATVKRKYRERNCDYIELDSNATDSGCGAASTEVGTLASFEFTFDACGCAIATIPADVINCLPLIGDRVRPRRSGNRKAIDMAGLGECNDYYRIGYFAITARYLDTDLNIESHLVAHGCASLVATTMKTVD